MTQSEFIEQVNKVAGITFRNATLSSWENGQSSPTSDLLPVISQILQTPVMHLFAPEPATEETIITETEAEEQPWSPGSEINLELYKKIFEEDPGEAFTQLLKQYKILSEAHEKLKAKNQKLEGKLAASNEFLKQLMDMNKG